ncbi:FAD-dependent oxidoreductase [Phragmitibacter flavus]|uniref:FAD-dependent oxidoreductase n=1 Tax=Phragmitibacter flavus TaxID=2576071 RepID=A0A5R8KFJ4_9BACT|nr:FAD-dependent oxidoreductase [Phragmitibacter flavus]TLD71084.1 FAD-dependent oxidoreductase [Phragmitibacter flavus]
MRQPILIIGQGLAGTAIAWRLWQCGIPFLIVDPNQSETCSKVAAGLITPITGMRLNLSWRIADLLPAAEHFYRDIEKQLGVGFYHSLPHSRLFKEPREIALWEKRRIDPAFIPWIDSESESESADEIADPALFHSELGGFRQQGSGWLDTLTYLEASRQFFEENTCCQQGLVNESDLDIRADTIIWHDAEFSHAILCRGWQQSASDLTPWLPFDAARGVMVDLEFESSILSRHIYNRGGWILPHSPDRWRAGSTYEFDFQRPLEDSLADLQKKLQALLRIPFTMTRPRAGVRPIIKGRQAVLGRHPANDRLLVFNGLGSKGAMKSPLLSRWLVDHLLDHQPLDEAIDIRSNL